VFFNLITMYILALYRSLLMLCLFITMLLDCIFFCCYIFTCESSYCFQHILAIAILSIRLVCPSVRPSICHTGGSVKNGAS